jgi:hypothetical protein
MRTKLLLTAVFAVLLTTTVATGAAHASPPAGVTDRASTADFGAQGCVTLDTKTVRNANAPTQVELWRCDSGWLALITYPEIGDQVYLRSAAGTITDLRTVRYQHTDTSTKTVGVYGGPWRACGKIPHATEVCTPNLW